LNFITLRLNVYTGSLKEYQHKAKMKSKMATLQDQKRYRAWKKQSRFERERLIFFLERPFLYEQVLKDTCGCKNCEFKCDYWTD
jgi:hypothetical protein